MGAEKVGEYLKRERELRGITLDEISEGTKISKRLLEYMETGRWEELPGEIFAKGFLKSYAEFIGISPEEILLRYEEEKLLDQGEREATQETGPKSRLKNVFLLAIFFLVSIVGYFSYKLFTQSQNIESSQIIEQHRLSVPTQNTEIVSDHNTTTVSGNATKDGKTH